MHALSLCFISAACFRTFYCSAYNAAIFSHNYYLYLCVYSIHELECAMLCRVVPGDRSRGATEESRK